MIPALLPDLTASDLWELFNCNHSVKNFEQKLERQFKIKHAFTFSSSRAGLYHILKANKIKNKKILVSSYTCCVVTEAIVQSGNQPVFLDTAKDSFNARITPALIKKHKDNLGAIIVTNLFGLTDQPEPVFLKKHRGFLLILDNALSPSSIPKRSAGLYDYIYTSSSARKPFSCLGGGVVLTDNEDNFLRLKNYLVLNSLKPDLLNQSKKFILALLLFFAFQSFLYPLATLIRYKTNLLNTFFSEKDHDIHSFRSEYFEPMADFQKRVGLNQLKKFNRQMRHRKEIGNLYYQLLKTDFPWIKQFWRLNMPFSHVPFLHPQRDCLARYLFRQGIETEKYFDYVIPRLPQYDNKQNFPHADKLAQQIINLPIFPNLKLSNVALICEKIISYKS